MSKAIEDQSIKKNKIKILEDELHSEHIRKEAHLTVGHFFELLEDHFATRKTIEFYAVQLDTTSNKLNKLIKSYFGFSATELIKIRLLIAIKKDLATTETSINMLAKKYLFSSASAFNRIFTLYTGMAPTRFRALAYNINLIK
ncbi:AraC family transcriptional regulator [Sphingobacterium sp. ML3W]|uniref:helix-turn-helix domain-containing protein n=1 Tax=Sphingobacterium sp. ML3W TaxID=1538644 RepID=UPI00249CE80C|nr:AraC family transcriptional regulator [Sphingobacterium sp. ML3W]WFA80898.1 AraC family transcriptional regulator [Sphingobacterium sp. ML3W]